MTTVTKITIRFKYIYLVGHIFWNIESKQIPISAAKKNPIRNKNSPSND